MTGERRGRSGGRAAEPPPAVDMNKVLQDMKALQDEVKKLREEREEEKQERDQERQLLAGLQTEVVFLRNTVAQQQSFIEFLEARDRQCNLVVTGVPEEDDGDLDGAVDDVEKCKKVFERMQEAGDQAEPPDTPSLWSDTIEVKRVGDTAEGKQRPIILKMSSKAERDAVLEVTKKLKEAGTDYKRIYVRKDIHPSVRKEWGRLRKMLKEEREKPTNQGANITLDYKSRVLLRNGMVIDRYSPTYFLQ